MNNNHKKIITLLSHEHWISSQELSKKLSVSPRQIRKYIHEIKSKDPTLIESSYYGYKLSHNYNLQINDTHNYVITDRTTYIIQKLIIHPEGLNIYDLCDEMFISESTLENDLKKVKNILITYHLILNRFHGFIHISGNEQEKRKLMNFLLSKYGYDSIKFGQKISMFQDEYNISDLKKPLYQILQNNHLIADEYSFHNILFHIIITIDRIRTQNQIDSKNVLNINFDNKIDCQRKKATIDIYNFLINHYQISLNEAEKNNLYIIIVGNTQKTAPTPHDELYHEVPLDQQYITLSKELLQEISSRYYLDSFNDEFIFQFAIHINNMLYRISMGYEAKNPMTLSIKQNYPFIYEIAVFLAQRISQKYHISINEAEITFLSFHIGGFLENRAKSDKIINCAFVYSSFLQLYTHYLDTLHNQFKQSLHIKAIISTQELDTLPENLDFIISTIPLTLDIPIVVIKPFANEYDLENIRKHIISLQNQKEILHVASHISTLFYPNLFLVNQEFNNKTEALIHMSKKIIDLGFADKNFTHDILQREEMSSTNFGQVAIPHSLHHTNKSFIYVAILKNSIDWGNKNIKLILMIGIKQEDSKSFSQILNCLVEVLYTPKNITTLCQQDSYDSFINLLIKMIKQIKL